MFAPAIIIFKPVLLLVDVLLLNAVFLLIIKRAVFTAILIGASELAMCLNFPSSI